MKVLDVANPVVITVFPESSLKEAIDILSNNPTGRIVVLKEEKPMGDSRLHCDFNLFS
ncbi:Uncharacterized protein J5U21_00857 [Saccharolobus shibatae]|uniref:CBS domain-containing protein n=1 Tax=Saccharolobus shibatae TaxID=2286 RepID=A0A8F5BTI7_9CREN|nr:Uncharacterized protein J5U21_00857 [Saccharolobus shibatae]